MVHRKDALTRAWQMATGYMVECGDGPPLPPVCVDGKTTLLRLSADVILDGMTSRVIHRKSSLYSP
jgi:hypothetical protein